VTHALEPTVDAPVRRADRSALRALHEVTKSLHASLDLPATLDAVTRGVVEVAGFGVACVNLAVDDTSFVVVAVAGDADARESLMGQVITAEQWQRMLDQSEQWGALRFSDGRTAPEDDEDLHVWVPDLPVPDDDDSWHPLDSLYAPLTAPSGEWVGVLCVDLPAGGRRPDADQCELLEMFADQAAIAIQHARMHAALQEQEAQARHAATHDTLTGLANRALLRDVGSAVAARAGTAGQQAAVLLVDLDGFKRVNDSDGHDAGDDVLREVAARLLATVPDADVVARVGGDEFVVVLSGPDLDARAARLARDLEHRISAPVVTGRRQHQVGASVGVAVSATSSTLSALLRVADAAMYERKRGSRRRH
jgi:diguanylate cyclase (GGDEF)-like protein